MKITTLSAVLCLAATTALADKKNTIASNAQDLSIAASVADKREARHHEINGVSVVKRSDGPKVVKRHGNQGKKRHSEHGIEAHKDGNRYHGRVGEGKEKKVGDDDEEEGKNGKKDYSGHGTGDKKDAGSGHGSGMKADEKEGKDSGDKKGNAGGDKGGERDPSGGGSAPATGGGSAPATGGGSAPATGGGSAPVAGGEDKQTTPTTPTTPAAGDEGKGGAGATNPSIPRDYSSPLWLVQPFGSSIWAQGETYVISWGPNPDPVYAEALKANTLVEIRLMQGPPDNLREIAVLSSGVDSSIHMLEWLVPTTVPPANDYSIRMSHTGDIDTYSHYFEIVTAGDPRSNKSNVGEPLQMPQKGNGSDSASKEPTKPALPPNPFPVPATPSKPLTPPPTVAKSAHASSAHSETHQGANMLALAMALFGAVYFL
ncbi:hypothetical protein BGZ97_002247 [Linnemannia gamsii]|jgi:hypothetical protein|uniref:Yeast cell wall synthesis Kre9/Knh1-like N-terminal domain-containing protein n=1 Tax=Linnemannia gamsii TaxID=64522 RepID=A0A9P6RK72_9FUNG|nr:hypothetical protein BGZ97_002247 [Linnemannia gamsii]